jgi:hypothetical protein
MADEIVIADIQTFTDADIVIILRRALVDSLFAKSYKIGERSLDRMTATELNNLLAVFERRVIEAANGGNMIAFANFNPPA